MSMATARDLLGAKVRKRRSRFEAALERYDRATFPERLDRLRWVERVMPRDYVLTLPPETFYLFNEAKDSFINGQFVGSLMLTLSFIEHVLAIALENKGYYKQAKGGLKSIVACLRENQSPLSPILNQIETLQDSRNPFAHLKPFTHQHTLGQRSLRARKSDVVMLEEDAKAALPLMYTVATKPAW